MFDSITLDCNHRTPHALRHYWGRERVPAHTHPLQKHVVRYKRSKQGERWLLTQNTSTEHARGERVGCGRRRCAPLAQSVDGLAVKLLWYTPLLHTKLTTAARVYSITNTPPCVARTCGASPPSLLPIEHGVERLRLRHHVGYANSGGQRRSAHRARRPLCNGQGDPSQR